MFYTIYVIYKFIYIVNIKMKCYNMYEIKYKGEKYMDKKKLLGGLLGILLGFIFSIPWILCYIYLKRIVVYLAIIIGFGILLGYKTVNKNVYRNNKFIAYLFISSVLIIVINTLIVIPIAILLKENVNISTDFLLYLYSDKEVFSGIIYDLVISILFAIIGVFPIINKLGTEGKGEQQEVTYEEFAKTMKELYIKYNALEKQNAIENKVINEEIEQFNYKNTLRYLEQMKTNFLICSNGIGKSYYNEKNENKKSASKKKIILYTSIILIGIAIGIFLGLMDTEQNNNVVQEQSKEISYEIQYEKQELSDISIDLPDYMFLQNSEEIEDRKYYYFLPKNINKTIFKCIEINEYDYLIFGDEQIEEFIKYSEEFYTELKYKILENRIEEVNSSMMIFFKIQDSEENIVYCYTCRVNNQTQEIYFTLNDNVDENKIKEIINNIIKTIKSN